MEKVRRTPLLTIVLLSLLGLGLLTYLTLPAIHIISKPVKYTEIRKNLTLSYIKQHYGIDTNSTQIIPRMVVVHWTKMNDFEEVYDLLNNETLSTERTDIQNASLLNVSSHFLIDQKGHIFQLLPLDTMARHTIGLNYNSIGIENIGGADDIDNLTDAQLEANIKLIKYLSKMLPSIKYLIGHLEYQTFENTPLWKELDNNYRTKKVDPGMRFINAIRENIPNLKKEYSK